MKNFFRGTIFFLCAIFCFSCATTKRDQKNSPCIYITNSKKFFLPPTDFLNDAVEEVMLFEGTFGGNEFAFPVFIKADADGIFLQVLNDFGTGIASVFYDGNSVECESDFFPENFKGEYIVADVQIAYCDFEKIKNSLAEISLSFVEENSSGADFVNLTKRVVYDKKKAIETFTWNGNSLAVENHLRGYKYTLTGVSDE